VVCIVLLEELLSVRAQLSRQSVGRAQARLTRIALSEQPTTRRALTALAHQAERADVTEPP